MSFSVVILSKNIQNLRVCVREIWANEPDAKIIVVDDGLEGTLGLGKDMPIRYVPGEKPFIFARNANIGIRAAGDDDVVLLNDDAVLKTPDGFSKIESTIKSHPEYGIISPVLDAVGNPNQMVRMSREGLRDEPRMVCFVCVYIPRTTINRVGLLDERYTGYGMDDDDYCFSVREAGLSIGVYDLCYVDHSTLRSSYRFHQSADFRPNLKRFIEKWGCDNWGKKKEESEWASLFPKVTK